MPLHAAATAVLVAPPVGPSTPRSNFLPSWMICSLACETFVYMLALRPAQSTQATLSFATPLLLTLACFALLKFTDPSSCVGIIDIDGARGRGATCRVSLVHVPRYDHYCTWVDEPIGAANHRAFLSFVSCMAATCLIGAAQLGYAASATGCSVAAAWHSNRSSVLVSCSCYGFAAGGLVSLLLAHQAMLVLTGRTAYEARRAVPKRGGECSNACERPGSGGGSMSKWRAFLAQTSPMLVLGRRRASE